MQGRHSNPPGLLTAAALQARAATSSHAVLRSGPSSSSSASASSSCSSSDRTNVTAAPDPAAADADAPHTPAAAAAAAAGGGGGHHRSSSFAFTRAGGGAGYLSDGDGASLAATSPHAQCMTLGARAMARHGLEDDRAALGLSPAASDLLSPSDSPPAAAAAAEAPPAGGAAAADAAGGRGEGEDEKARFVRSLFVSAPPFCFSPGCAPEAVAAPCHRRHTAVPPQSHCAPVQLSGFTVHRAGH